MSDDPSVLGLVPKVSTIMEALKTGHARFPVLNKSKQVVGVIPANFLIVLIEN